MSDDRPEAPMRSALADCPEADTACLKAALQNGLRRSWGSRIICPGSVEPTAGFWARSTRRDNASDPDKGGPWSLERVHRLAEMGLLSIAWDGMTATLTPAGRALAKPRRKKPATTNEAAQ